MKNSTAKSLLGGCLVSLALAVPAEAGHHKQCACGAVGATGGEIAPMLALAADGNTGMQGATAVVDVATGQMASAQASPQVSPQMVPKQVPTLRPRPYP
jgi:hypothetical protein